MKGYIILIGTILTVAVTLSLLWGIPYIYTAIGFAAWAFIGHLVTIDDDMPGGWSNPDGTLPFPWGALVIKGVVLSGLIAVAILIPIIRSMGA